MSPSPELRVPKIRNWKCFCLYVTRQFIWRQILYYSVLKLRYTVRYLFTYKPSLAISRDPKLVRHDCGRRSSLSGTRKNPLVPRVVVTADGTKLRPKVIFKGVRCPRNLVVPDFLRVSFHKKEWLDESGVKEWIRQCFPQTPHNEKFIDQQFHLVFITMYFFIDFDLATSQSQNLYDISLSSRDLILTDSSPNFWKNCLAYNRINTVVLLFKAQQRLKEICIVKQQPW